MSSAVTKIKNKVIRRLFARVSNLSNNRVCPICDWEGWQFNPNGIDLKRRYDSRCPNCSSLERHRLAYMVMKDKLKNPKTLHVAPEPSIEPWLKRISASYISIDLYNEAMMKMDLTDMTFEDNTFSLIWCSNVLEHIPADDKAINEMYRVCEPGGMAAIQVPIWRYETYENPEIKSKEDRLKYFYQHDHVRLYGLDIVDRLSSAGFKVEVIRAQDLGPELVFQHSLSLLSTNEIFVCYK